MVSKANRTKALADLNAGKLPDFDLTPVRRLPRTLLLSDAHDTPDRAQLKRIAITLALVFNDAKDLYWVMDLFEYFPPADPFSDDAYTGQRVAMPSFFFRHLCGVAYELGKIIEANREIFGSTAFAEVRRLVTAKNTEALEAWDHLLKVFARPPKDPLDKKRRRALPSKVTRCIEFIRHHSFHYGYSEEMAELSAGFDRHFRSDAERRNQALYVSFGENMERTRFFFADAAALAMVRQSIAGEGATMKDLRAFMRAMNFALRFVVEALLTHLDPTKP